MATPYRHFTDEEISEMKAMRKTMGIHKLCRHFQCGPLTVYKVLGDQARPRCKTKPPTRIPQQPRETIEDFEQDVAKRLAEIPQDTRNVTQRFFGDPLPGRSALDRMRKHA